MKNLFIYKHTDDYIGYELNVRGKGGGNHPFPSPLVEDKTLINGRGLGDGIWNIEDNLMIGAGIIEFEFEDELQFERKNKFHCGKGEGVDRTGPIFSGLSKKEIKEYIDNLSIEMIGTCLNMHTNR